MSAPSAVGTARTASPWAKRLAAVVLLGALLAAARFLPIERWLVDFVAWVRGAGLRGMVVFALVYVLATVLFLPGVILTLGAGFAYGVVAGTAGGGGGAEPRAPPPLPPRRPPPPAPLPA